MVNGKCLKTLPPSSTRCPSLVALLLLELICGAVLNSTRRVIGQQDTTTHLIEIQLSTHCRKLPHSAITKVHATHLAENVTQ